MVPSGLSTKSQEPYWLSGLGGRTRMCPQAGGQGQGGKTQACCTPDSVSHQAVASIIGAGSLPASIGQVRLQCTEVQVVRPRASGLGAGRQVHVLLRVRART